MKRKTAVALLLAGTIFFGSAAIATDAGSLEDPLVALSWLKDTFLPDVLNMTQEQIDDHETDLSLSTEGTELRVKRGDLLTLTTGTSITPLAGELTGSSDGAVVDITEGVELEGSLSNGHRYLVAEDTTAHFTVSSDTAVVRLAGKYDLQASTETDYNAMAERLKAMGLFQGSNVPYGSGYELEEVPTRIQGLIMFLRLMGEEQYALNYPGRYITFADVPEWAMPYVAYAYDKGYTKGVGVDDQWQVVFGTNSPLRANDYLTFLLRALKYSEDGGDFAWLTAVQDAHSLGVLTQGEVDRLTGESPFLRAQVAYLSYFALGEQPKGSDLTLLEQLLANGAVQEENANLAMTDPLERM